METSDQVPKKEEENSGELSHLSQIFHSMNFWIENEKTVGLKRTAVFTVPKKEKEIKKAKIPLLKEKIMRTLKQMHLRHYI